MKFRKKNKTKLPLRIQVHWIYLNLVFDSVMCIVLESVAKRVPKGPVNYAFI